MNKEECGTVYMELMARKYLLQLLKKDRYALMRVMTDVKLAIYEEESVMATEELIRRVK
jgi:hypothetical protein